MTNGSRYILTANLTAEERYKIYESNTRRAYPRLDKAVKAKGRWGPNSVSPGTTLNGLTARRSPTHRPKVPGRG
jgi:hypothetical protein